MKKKLLVLVLIMGMIFSVVGCASSPQAATTTLSTTINTQTAAESSTAISKTWKIIMIPRLKTQKLEK